MDTNADHRWMQLAIDKAKSALENGQHPFGAVVVGPDGQLVAAEHNLVEQDFDASAHGEVVAIRAAGKALASVMLTGCTLYTTCEPCLMCGSVIIRCGLTRVVYGARATDLRGYTSTLGLHVEEVVEWANREKLNGDTPITVTPDFMRDECLELYARWP
ncbi:MAG: nucleoside deaminase [Chloroflexi bacterium]|nr:nucleoside deaminase [Chloroflexota bacterium]